MAKKEEKTFTNLLIIGVVLLVLVASANAYMLSSLSDNLGGSRGKGLIYSKDISKIDLSSIKSTGQSLAVLFPLDKIKTQQDAISLLIPTGTPEYGDALGVSFDDPVGSLDKLSRQIYPQIKAELKSNPELWKRYINLATKPVGISCEFCCGVGPIGISSNGELRCGCSHNPAVQAISMWLIKNTDYSDAEIVREVMMWKSLWFPKNMIELGTKLSGGDVDLNSLPGMVGGC
ncbi:hypothetical protein J4230_01935 [Candidatus Woesearchaeota archaeon]|nr:hypothetical protein [Candidatus Woesearchaeota archaeon]